MDDILLLSGDTYNWVKAVHVMAVISWMAGLLYMPRLFVYHTQAQVGSAQSETFKVMERRLMKAIMNPAMVVSWVLGLWMLYSLDTWKEPWVHAKLTAVVLLTVSHFYMIKWKNWFANDVNEKPEVFYRVANEVPTILMIIIVIFVIVKPF